MALNNTIARVRALASKKVAGVHSLTLGETVCFALVCIFAIPRLKAKVPFLKNVGNMGLYASLALLFVFLYLD